MNNYKLYVHICPNGKRYYGITKQEPKRRWLSGAGYRNNQYFFRAINKYGWDNIEHIVLFDSLTEHEAKELEQYMIQWYNTANYKYGYNQSLGGDGGYSGYKLSEETKRKKSKPVICITTKKIFYGIREAERICGVANQHISQCCQGKKKSAGKHNGQKLVWRYINYKHKKFFRVA